MDAMDEEFAAMRQATSRTGSTVFVLRSTPEVCRSLAAYMYIRDMNNTISVLKV